MKMLTALAIVKIRSFKEFAHGNLGLDLARDLKKGAIVKVEDQDLFLSLAGADLIAVADNKNLLSDVFRGHGRQRIIAQRNQSGKSS